MLRTACIFLAIAAVYASDVVELGDSDFDSRTADFPIALVKFYAPWCGHCKRLAPEFDKAAPILKNDENPVALIKVDCTEAGKDVCQKYGVSGYPTLKIFRAGKLNMDYNGPREADGIVKYMRARAGPSAKNLETVEIAETFFGKEAEHAIVAYFGNNDKNIKNEFMQVADSEKEEFRFGYAEDLAVIEKYAEKESLYIYRPKRMATKMEENVVKYDGKFVAADMTKWIKQNIHGLAGLRTTANQEMFPKPLITVYYDVDYGKNAKGTNYWRNRVIKVAKKLQGEGKKINFAIASGLDFEHELTEFNMRYVDKPIVAARDASDQKFPMTSEFSMETLERFANDVLEGKLKPYLKSEPIPDDNSAPVKVVVAENFNEIVNDPERDVLIEFYAPWCGHCKTLAPKYDELAEKLAADNSVTIAKMDATANDINKKIYDVRGFPTIYYAPKNSKNSPKKYEGGREVADFLKYLAKESTDGLKGYDRKGKKVKKSDEL